MTPSTAVEDDATPISAPLPPPPPSATQPTGPVESLPSPPAPTVSRRPRDRAALAGRALGTAALLLLEAGLLLDFGARRTLWTTVPLWCGFATLAALVGLLVHVPGSGRSRTDRAWRISAGGLLGLAVFWVLVVLPLGDTDRGFVLTAALGCLGASLWLTAGRKG